MRNTTIALVTAAKDEDTFLARTIQSVLAQRLRPSQWIIVDDGSSDRTGEIAETYASRYEWIRTLRIPRQTRDFASKVYALNAGYNAIESKSFQFVGILDGDIQLCADYYETLCRHFADQPELGVAGGRILDCYPDRLRDHCQGCEQYHVSGAVQLFRQDCFEQLGGFTPIECGGEDVVAEVRAEMNGWRVETFRDCHALHLKPGPLHPRPSLKRHLADGRMHYQLGYDPVYYLAYSMKRAWNPPPLASVALKMLGFTIAGVKRTRRPVSEDFVNFMRQRQWDRLRGIAWVNR